MPRPSLTVLLSLILVPLSVEARQATDLTVQTPQSTVSQDLKRLSIEELAELDVTSVSRRIERLSQVAAAVSLIRQEDLRRTGVTTLAEAMRLADALDVARFDGSTWNITARGFNIVTANKLLVLMDGRTLYSPLYAGTFWDVQDTVLADIDRIEVIRGPGGTIWGANAVNGVINIITKDASQTRGTHVLLTAGNENQLTTTLRHGGRLRGDGNYRIFGKYRNAGANKFADGASASNPLQLGLMGFRLDSNARRASRWSLQGTAYRGSEGFVDRDDADVNGGFLQGQWSHRFSPNADLRVGAYYDYTYRRVPLQFEEGRHTVDVDAQHHVLLGARHDLVFGGELRVTTARDVGSAVLFFDPDEQTNYVGGMFVQDEIALDPRRVFLTIGSKFEGNDYTGIDIQPTVRLRVSPSDRQTIWGAISRAVRLPTRVDTAIRLLDPASGRVVIRGNEDFLSESVVAYEGGYRIRPSSRFSIDVAGFANRYDHIRSQEFPSSFGPVILLGNTIDAVTSGVETAGTVQILDRWRVHASYSYLWKELTADPGSRDVSRGANEANDPPFLVSIRSYLDLPHGLAFDGMFRHVDRRPNPIVPAYSSLDLRLGWTVRPGWELSLVGQNLFDPSHPEFGAPTPRRHEFERGVYVRSTWHF